MTKARSLTPEEIAMFGDETHVEVIDRTLKTVPRGEVAEEMIRRTEDELFVRSSVIVDGALRFADLGPEDKEPPPEWVQEYGKKGAWRRFRAAQYALMSAKEAPVGLSIAKAVMVSGQKSRAAKDSGPKTVNIQMVRMPEQLVPQFPEKKVD